MRRNMGPSFVDGHELLQVGQSGTVHLELLVGARGRHTPVQPESFDGLQTEEVLHPSHLNSRHTYLPEKMLSISISEDDFLDWLPVNSRDDANDEIRNDAFRNARRHIFGGFW